MTTTRLQYPPLLPWSCRLSRKRRQLREWGVTLRGCATRLMSPAFSCALRYRSQASRSPWKLRRKESCHRCRLYRGRRHCADVVVPTWSRRRGIQRRGPSQALQTSMDLPNSAYHSTHPTLGTLAHLDIASVINSFAIVLSSTHVNQISCQRHTPPKAHTTLAMHAH